MKIIKILFLSSLITISMYLCMISFPKTFFPYCARNNTLKVCSSEKFDKKSGINLLEDISQRIPPYKENGRLFTVYIAQSDRLFSFFTNYNYRAGGVAYPFLGESIFIRPAEIKQGQLHGSSGNLVPLDRPLSYFIAHEITHIILGRRIGFLSYMNLEKWKNEGLCDYFAKKGSFNFNVELSNLKNKEIRLSPKKSGLYLRYHLIVYYLIHYKKMSVNEILKNKIDRKKIEHELLNISF